MQWNIYQQPQHINTDHSHAITNDVLIELIKNTEQPDKLNVRMVLEEEIDGDEEDDGSSSSSDI